LHDLLEDCTTTYDRRATFVAQRLRNKSHATKVTQQKSGVSSA